MKFVSVETLDKIIAWLGSHDSHGIYDAKALAADFEAATGERECWRTHTAEVTRQLIASDPRGGSLDKEIAVQAYGYEVAFDLASEYAAYMSRKMGRGFMFHDCIAGIQLFRNAMAERDAKE